MIHFLRLVRWINLLIIALTMFGLGWYFDLVNGLGESFTLRIEFFILVLSIIFIAAAGNVINDYYDVEIDKINKEEKRVVDKHISGKVALTYFAIFNFLGLIGGFSLWYLLNESVFLLLNSFAISALWMYSYRVKKMPLLGNLLVSVLIGIVPIITGVYFNIFYGSKIGGAFPFEVEIGPDFPMYLSLGFGLLAFLLNLAREIGKDIEDIEGDKKGAIRSLPIVYGENVAKYTMVIILLLVICAASFATNWWDIGGEKRWVILPLIAAVFISIYVVYTLMQPLNKKVLKRINLLLKTAMVSGALTPVFWVFLML